MKNRYAFKMLLRSPVKTVLTVLLLAAAAFLLLDNLSSYAMQTEAIRQAEEKVEGVLTVERSQVLRPADASNTEFLFTDPTSQETPYYLYVRNERVHHEALSEDDLAALEALPYIDAVDRRYLTAGISEDYKRLDAPISYYGYTDRVILEATVKGYEDFPEFGRIRPSYTIADGDGNRIFYLKDVVLLAGSRGALEQLEKLQKSGISLFIFAMAEKYIGVEPDIRMHSGGGGDVVNCYDYDIDREQLLSIQKDRRYIFVVRAPRAIAEGDPNQGFFLGDDSRKGWWPYITDVTDLPENYLETEEFAPLRELIQVTNDDLRTFDVVYTDDMASIRRVARNQLTAVQGRLLGPEDAGKANCVVSERFLSENGLNLGDTVTLQLGNYLMEQFQPLGAVAVTRGRYAAQWTEQTFTIVGTWQDSSDRHWQEQEHYNYYSIGSWQDQDPYWAYSDNTVFVPTSFLPAGCDTVNHVFRPGEVSFLVRDADKLGAFAEECLPMVEEMGLQYAWNDGGWPLISEKLAETKALSRMKLLIFSAAALLAVGLTLYLFLHRRRREYAILRALGAPRRAASKTLWLPLLFLAVIAVVIGTGAAWLRSGAAAAKSAADFAEAGLEAMPSAHIGVYLLGAISLLLAVALLAALYLRALGKRSPLALLQDGNRKKDNKGGIQDSEIGPEALSAAAAVLALPVTVTGKPVRGFLRRYILRHIRRAGAKTLLALLLAALLVGAVGQMTVLRSRYGEMMKNVRVEVDFTGGLSLGKAEKLMKTGMLSDPVYVRRYDDGIDQGELELELAEVVFTNRLDAVISDPITWLEGWDEETAMQEKGKICILPAPVMERKGIKLGDEVRINELGCIEFLKVGHDYFPKTDEDALVFRDKYRSFYTVIGRVETTWEPTVVYAPVTAFGSYYFFGTTLYLDSATFTLNNYHDADKVRQMAAEIQYTAKKPPVFTMDTADADRIYRVYRLIETLYPLTVAAALILGTLLPVLMILQEQKEAAILRALGWSKKLTIRRLTLEQAVLCLMGLALAIAALFAVNGAGFLGVILVPLLYVLAHFALCVAASAAISASILQKSPMRLLQTKE
ncbi:MAG: ABC transporter permease [Oscillospiraceae bacterium]|nr:ABC transporter permease [Oscillospiraceae bacterium]